MDGFREQLECLSRGAEFVRADLHIHSYGDHGSPDVSDSSMTPQAIVDAALQEGLRIIGITDHNEIRNIEGALEAAEGREILVVPGVELSTPQGHLLAYAPTMGTSESFSVGSRFRMIEKRVRRRWSSASISSANTAASALPHILTSQPDLRRCF